MKKELVLLSDIHGNAPALQAVLEKEGLNKEYAVLGDIHGLLAYPQKTMALLEEMDPQVLLGGNHCRAIFHHNEGHVNSDALSKFELEHTLRGLSDKQQDWMESLPFMEVWDDDPDTICAAHAKPWPSEASGYELGNSGVPKGDIPHVASKVAGDYDIVLSGHTHSQYAVDCSKFGHDVRMIGAGTLGYEGDYATLDTETGEVKLKSVEYDEERVRKHIQIVLPDDAPHTREWY